MVTKRILVSTELDELSAKVTKFAVGLSTQLGVSEIILLNVIIPATPQSFSATADVSTQNTHHVNLFNTELMRKHQLQVSAEAKKLSTDKVIINPIVRFRDSKTDLNSIIESAEAGLLIFGSRDEHSFLNPIFGTMTDKMIRKVDYPAIVLKEDTPLKNIHHIAVALDVNEEDQSGLGTIADFAKSLHARMNLVYIDTNGNATPDSAIEKIHTLALEYKLEDYAINVVSSHKLEEGIKGFVRKTNPDMIAVLSQGKGKIKKLIFGSSTQDIIKEADIPVFITKIH